MAAGRIETSAKNEQFVPPARQKGELGSASEKNAAKKKREEAEWRRKREKERSE